MIGIFRGEDRSSGVAEEEFRIQESEFRNKEYRDYLRVADPAFRLRSFRTAELIGTSSPTLNS
jgi:hypothetical protein